jgi:hypothetical protein
VVLPTPLKQEVSKYFETVEIANLKPHIFLIDHCGFRPSSKMFHLYGDVTIAGEGLQNLGLCSALRAFQQGGIFIVPHLL